MPPPAIGGNTNVLSFCLLSTRAPCVVLRASQCASERVRVERHASATVYDVLITPGPTGKVKVLCGKQVRVTGNVKVNGEGVGDPCALARTAQ